jgi:surface antigen
MKRKMLTIAVVLALATLAIGSGETQAAAKRRGGYEQSRYVQHTRPPQRTREVRVTEVRRWTRHDAWSRPPWWGRPYRYRPTRPTTVWVEPPRTRYGEGREFWGTLIGGATGGILGSQVGRGDGRTAAIIGGTVLGLLVGGDIGRSMDAVDHLYVERTLESVPARTTTAWQNPDSSVRYEVTPTTTYESPDGRYCREYLTTATVAGERQQLYGTACRQPDGSWEVAH